MVREGSSMAGGGRWGGPGGKAPGRGSRRRGRSRCRVTLTLTPGPPPAGQTEPAPPGRAGVPGGATSPRAEGSLLAAPPR